MDERRTKRSACQPEHFPRHSPGESARCMCAHAALKGASLSPHRNPMMAATKPKQSIIKEHGGS